MHSGDGKDGVALLQCSPLPLLCRVNKEDFLILFLRQPASRIESFAWKNHGRSPRPRVLPTLWRACMHIGSALHFMSLCVCVFVRAPSRSTCAAACGFFHTAAVTEDGSLYTWGLGAQGQLGHGDWDNRLLPLLCRDAAGDASHTPTTSVLRDVAVVAAGRGHTVATTQDGAVWCWGSGASGQLGTGDRERRTRPTQLRRGLFEFAVATMAACGADHTVVVTATGSVYTWGGNARGQLGLGDHDSRARPTAVHGCDSAVMVAAGDDHTLAVGRKPLSRVWSWGYGAQGALGLGDTGDVIVPTPVLCLCDIP